jgi:hypothetical protein
MIYSNKNHCVTAIFTESWHSAWYVSPPPFLHGDYWINSRVRTWAYRPEGNWAPCNFIIRSRNLAALPDRRCKFKIFCLVHFMCSKLFMAFQLLHSAPWEHDIYNGGFQWTGLPHGLPSSAERNVFRFTWVVAKKKIINPLQAHQHAAALHQRKSTSS